MPTFTSVYPDFPITGARVRLPQFGSGDIAGALEAAGSGFYGNALGLAAGSGQTMDAQTETAFHAARTADAAEGTRKALIFQIIAGILALAFSGAVTFWAVRAGVRGARRK